MRGSSKSDRSQPSTVLVHDPRDVPAVARTRHLCNRREGVRRVVSLSPRGCGAVIQPQWRVASLPYFPKNTRLPLRAYVKRLWLVPFLCSAVVPSDSTVFAGYTPCHWLVASVAAGGTPCKRLVNLAGRLCRPPRFHQPAVCTSRRIAPARPQRL